MTHQRSIVPDFKVIESHFALPVLEETLDVPARERYQKQILEWYFRRRIRQKVLQISRQNIPEDEKSLFLARFFSVSGEEPGLTNFPNDGPLIRPSERVKNFETLFFRIYCTTSRLDDLRGRSSGRPPQTPPGIPQLPLLVD